ncbi:hypothetical protein GGR50DRAFT_83006 [Xylaria sp. CBS 124048]|nr:hypothetical protein GGR50DRAFT_83006 [Xylaria sp. CBS 124048]
MVSSTFPSPICPGNHRRLSNNNIRPSMSSSPSHCFTRTMSSWVYADHGIPHKRGHLSYHRLGWPYLPISCFVSYSCSSSSSFLPRASTSGHTEVLHLKIFIESHQNLLCIISIIVASRIPFLYSTFGIIESNRTAQRLALILGSSQGSSVYHCNGNIHHLTPQTSNLFPLLGHLLLKARQDGRSTVRLSLLPRPLHSPVHHRWLGLHPPGPCLPHSRQSLLAFYGSHVRVGLRLPVCHRHVRTVHGLRMDGSNLRTCFRSDRPHRCWC